MIAIIDYKAGNLTSVARALFHIGYECIVTSDPEKIEKSERIVFPGVGAAGSAMNSLKEMKIDKIILDSFDRGKPVLGICLGTQVIMGYSEENDTNCVGLIPGEVKAFPERMKSEDDRFLKIPHMGWNSINIKTDHPVLAGLDRKDEFYFVHGYYPEPQNEKNIFASTEYGITFASVMGMKNLIATQFHPEKSGRPGLTILKNFCEWKPC